MLTIINQTCNTVKFIVNTSSWCLLHLVLCTSNISIVMLTIVMVVLNLHPECFSRHYVIRLELQRYLETEDTKNIITLSATTVIVLLVILTAMLQF